jgi:hypothetical protein
MMAAYTFFWNNHTWDNWSKSGSAKITYVAGKLQKPFSEIKKGDEIFVVTVKNQRLFVGGRLIASGGPVDKATASQKFPSEALIDKDAYVIADPEMLGIFRPNESLDAGAVRLLEMIISQKIVFKDFTQTSFPQDFLNTQRITESSAKKFRALLLLPENEPSIGDAKLEGSLAEAEAHGHSEDVKCFRAIMTRRGQPDFRRKLLAAYGRRCCFSGCCVEEVLEAAHIQAHADVTNYSTRNGLLLRADLHTLFDLHLIGVDEWGRIKVAKKLKESDYWKMHGQKMRLPDGMGDHPSQFELAKRLKKLAEQDSET